VLFTPEPNTLPLLSISVSVSRERRALFRALQQTFLFPFASRTAPDGRSSQESALEAAVLAVHRSRCVWGGLCLSRRRLSLSHALSFNYLAHCAIVSIVSCFFLALRVPLALSLRSHGVLCLSHPWASLALSASPPGTLCISSGKAV
jgi:hypothetical protein